MVLMTPQGAACQEISTSAVERAIRDNEFVVIVCTPRYKRRSDAREGGVGYEEDISGQGLELPKPSQVQVLRKGTGR